MTQIDENTVLMGITELRKKLPQLVKSLKDKKLVILNRNTPFAVLQSFEKYQETEKTIKELDNMLLRYMGGEN